MKGVRPDDSDSPVGPGPAGSEDRAADDGRAGAPNGFDARLHPDSGRDDHLAGSLVSSRTATFRTAATGTGPTDGPDAAALATTPSPTPLHRGLGSGRREPAQSELEQRPGRRAAFRLTLLCLIGAALLVAASAALLRTGINARGDGSEVAATVVGVWVAGAASALFLAGIGRLGRREGPGGGDRGRQPSAPLAASNVVNPRAVANSRAHRTTSPAPGSRPAARRLRSGTGTDGRPDQHPRARVAPESLRRPSAGLWS